MGLRCNKVERTVWWFLAPYTSLYPSSVPLYPLPILPAPEDVPLSLPSPCLAAEGLLRGVDHVEEAVLVPLLLVDLGDGCGHGHHAVLVDQQEEGLRGVQLQPAPDDLDQLAHVDVVRYQELGLVQNRQLFLSLISLNDDRDLVGVLITDLLDLFAPVSECPPLFEGSVGRHLSRCYDTVSS